MKSSIHELCSSDPFLNEQVYFSMPSIGIEKTQVREKYRSLQCIRCGKFDEYKALDLGLEKLKLKTKRDVAITLDFCLVVSDRFRKVFEDARFTGMKFIATSSEGLFVIRPSTVVDTDPAKTKMELVGAPCHSCGRYEETCFAPSIEAMKLPVSEDEAFSPALRTEKSGVAMMDIRISGKIAEVLKSAKLTGIDWTSTKRICY